MNYFTCSIQAFELVNHPSSFNPCYLRGESQKMKMGARSAHDLSQLCSNRLLQHSRPFLALVLVMLEGRALELVAQPAMDSLEAMAAVEQEHRAPLTWTKKSSS